MPADVISFPNLSNVLTVKFVLLVGLIVTSEGVSSIWTRVPPPTSNALLEPVLAGFETSFAVILTLDAAFVMFTFPVQTPFENPLFTVMLRVPVVSVSLIGPL